MHKISNIEVDGLQQQKTLGSTFISQEQESDFHGHCVTQTVPL